MSIQPNLPLYAQNLYGQNPAASPFGGVQQPMFPSTPMADSLGGFNFNGLAQPAVPSMPQFGMPSMTSVGGNNDPFASLPLYQVPSINIQSTNAMLGGGTGQIGNAPTQPIPPTEPPAAAPAEGGDGGDKKDDKLKPHSKVIADGIKNKKTPGQIGMAVHKNKANVVKKLFGKKKK